MTVRQPVYAEPQSSEVERFRPFIDGQGDCATASSRVASEIAGIAVECGYYRYPETVLDVWRLWDPEPGFRDCELDVTHWWNRLPDGRILDVTHCQFGGEEIALLSPSDAEYQRYVPLGSMKREEAAVWEERVRCAAEQAQSRPDDTDLCQLQTDRP